MSHFTIYHNPACSKSRAALALLRQHGVEPRVIEYLRQPPAPAQIQELLVKLGIPAEQLVRKRESIFKAQYAGQQLNEAQWIAALTSHPVLIERPIVVHGKRAVIGRPPENVLTLLPPGA